jgi:hypothetical protein
MFDRYQSVMEANKARARDVMEGRERRIVERDLLRDVPVRPSFGARVRRLLLAVIRRPR